MQLVVHAPFGSRLNRAWGLALRKRFCRRFNFELQAAATEDAIVLSLSTSHSFPLDEVVRYLHSATALDVLVQALLDAPLFGVRWRWNATTALALPRFAGGRKVAPQLQRMKSEDLLAAVFPDQVACAENLAGDREVPEHPLVAQTMHDCLDEAMDAAGWLEAAARHRGRRDRGRRARRAGAFAARRRGAERAAVCLPRRRADRGAQDAGGAEPPLRRSGERDDLGQLDADAIAGVRDEAWPRARNADEMHEALAALGVVADSEARCERGLGNVARRAGGDRSRHSARRRRDGRHARPACGSPPSGSPRFARSIPVPRCNRRSTCRPSAPTASRPRTRPCASCCARASAASGPATAPTLAAPLGLARADVERALLALQGEGYVLQGRFTPDLPPAPTPSGASAICSRASIATR